MIGKLLVAFAAPVLLSNAQPSGVVLTDIPQVRQVLCDGVRGTAFRTGSHAFVTARHVAHNDGCAIDGEPIVVTWESAELDIAVLRTAVPGEPLKIDCGGFRDGNGYAAVGHARGWAVQQAVFVVFSAEMDAALPAWGHFRTLIGDRFIPGQSGGPVIDKDGEVVGLTNGYNSAVPISYSLPMSETPLCQNSVVR